MLFCPLIDEETAEFDLNFAFGFKRSKPSGTGIAKSSPKGEVHLVVSWFHKAFLVINNILRAQSLQIYLMNFGGSLMEHFLEGIAV